MKTLLHKKNITKWFTSAALFCMLTGTAAAQIVAWDPTGVMTYGPSPWAATTADANITVGGLTRGAGINTTGSPANNAWGGVNWTGGATNDATFTITASVGYTVSLSELNLFYRRSGTGPATGTLEYAIDAGSYISVSPLAFPVSTAGGAAHAPIDLSGITDLQNVAAGSVIHLRILPTGGGAAGTWYVFGSGLSVNGAVTSTTPVCTDPSGLVTSSLNSSSVTIDWNSIASITGFEYVLDMNAADPAGAGTTTTGTSYTDNTLSASTLYYFHLRTDCGSGNYSNWVTLSFTTPAPCADPTGLVTSGITTTDASFTWDSETGITGFEYVLDMNAADPSGAGTATTGSTYTDNTLAASTVYYFHLRKDCGSGDYSDWVTVSFTTLTPCADPTGLMSSGITHNTVVVDWDPSAGATFEYVLDMVATDPAGAGTATGATTYDAAGTLSPATPYYFHLRSDCGGGNFSDWVTISFTTDIATGVDAYLLDAFALYPNPVQNTLSFVATNESLGGTLTLSDMAGKVLMKTQVNSTVTTIDLSGFSNQVYVLSFGNENMNRTFKVVKQ